jgi:hypothetical protein
VDCAGKREKKRKEKEQINEKGIDVTKISENKKDKKGRWIILQGINY